MKILSKSGQYGVLVCLYLNKYNTPAGYIAVKGMDSLKSQIESMFDTLTLEELSMATDIHSKQKS